MSGRVEGRVQDRVAIITGAARGQGEAEARLLAAEGARVVLTDVLDEEGEAVAADIGEAARYRHLDVSDEDAWAEVVAETTGTEGGPHILINNAGILSFNSITGQDPAGYRKVLEVNLVGAFLGIRAVARAIGDAGGGAIVNVCSIGGMEGQPLLSAYASSKWGLRGLSRTAAIELGPKGIRVNAICPGGIDTPMTRFGGDESALGTFYERLPIRRIGTVDDVASTVLFLASEEAGYVTGAELVVDGGHLAGDASLLET